MTAASDPQIVLSRVNYAHHKRWYDFSVVHLLPVGCDIRLETQLMLVRGAQAQCPKMF